MSKLKSVAVLVMAGSGYKTLSWNSGKDTPADLDASSPSSELGDAVESSGDEEDSADPFDVFAWASNAAYFSLFR